MKNKNKYNTQMKTYTKMKNNFQLTPSLNNVMLDNTNHIVDGNKYIFGILHYEPKLYIIPLQKDGSYETNLPEGLWCFPDNQFYINFFTSQIYLVGKNNRLVNIRKIWSI